MKPYDFLGGITSMSYEFRQILALEKVTAGEPPKMHYYVEVMVRTFDTY